MTAIAEDGGRSFAICDQLAHASGNTEKGERLYVNSVFWAVGRESEIPKKADVSYVGGDWKASPFGGGKFRQGLKPGDFAVKAE